MKFRSYTGVVETKTVLRKPVHFKWIFFHTRKFDHCANAFASGENQALYSYMFV